MLNFLILASTAVLVMSFIALIRPLPSLWMPTRKRAVLAMFASMLVLSLATDTDENKNATTPTASAVQEQEEMQAPSQAAPPGQQASSTTETTLPTSDQDYRSEIEKYMIDPCMLATVEGQDLNKMLGGKDTALRLLKAFSKQELDQAMQELLPIVSKLDKLEDRVALYEAGKNMCIEAGLDEVNR